MRIAVWLVFLLAPAAARAVGEGQDGFPNWAERVIHEWMNRARSDPQADLAGCSKCAEKACYAPIAPIAWTHALNRAARFHSDEMLEQSYFAHNSACKIVSGINAIYPGACNGAASCACMGGVKGCPCSSPWERIGLFGGSGSGEIIAGGGNDPSFAFYLWLYEPYSSASCGYGAGNGHRYQLLATKPSTAVGFGVSPSNGASAVGDFGGPAGQTAKIPSGSHYPRQAASVDAWANWYDTAGPAATSVNVDGSCMAMTLGRGAATNGAWHATITGVESGCHRYYFQFKDAGGGVVTFPTSGSLGIGPAGSCADWEASRPAACDGGTVGAPQGGCRLGAPERPPLVPAAMVGLALLLRRRRRSAVIRFR